MMLSPTDILCDVTAKYGCDICTPCKEYEERYVALLLPKQRKPHIKRLFSRCKYVRRVNKTQRCLAAKGLKHRDLLPFPTLEEYGPLPPKCAILYAKYLDAYNKKK